MKRTFLSTVFFAAVAFCAFATPVKEAQVAKLRSELSSVSSRKDSIKILYDILDLSPRKDYQQIGEMLYGVATREKDHVVRADVLRLMSNSTSDDAVLARLQRLASGLPKGTEQKETELFVKIRRIALQARIAPENKRREMITRMMAFDGYDKIDDYEKIERLYTICVYLSTYIQGEILEEYLDGLDRLMKRTDIKSYALYNTFYTESANIYSSIGNSQKALEADRKLLGIIGELEKKYKEEGRKYRNYNVNKYIVYRRMLSNYKSLPLQEVNRYYNRILELCKIDEEVASDFRAKPRVKAYYAMKNRHYAEAVALIKEQLKLPLSVTLRPRLLEMLMEASLSLNDKATFLSAKAEFDSLGRVNDLNNPDIKYNELKIRYDANILKAKNSRLELENKQEQISSTRRMMGFVIGGWVVLLVLLGILLYYWGRYRKTVSDISAFVDSLAAERDKLKLQRYHDYYKEHRGEEPAGSRPETGVESGRALSNKTSLADKMNYIINDIMYISSIGHGESSKYKGSDSVSEIMRQCAAKAERNLTEGKTIKVTYPDPDFRINVDAECLRYLIDHILVVAEKLTPAGGEFELLCTEEKTLKRARFVFLHTGTPFPFGKEEKIFDNFVNYAELARQGDAALRICRMINFLINSSLIADQSYEKGGKLVLLIPMK